MDLTCQIGRARGPHDSGLRPPHANFPEYTSFRPKIPDVSLKPDLRASIMRRRRSARGLAMGPLTRLCSTHATCRNSTRPIRCHNQKADCQWWPQDGGFQGQRRRLWRAHLKGRRSFRDSGEPISKVVRSHLEGGGGGGFGEKK